MSLRTGLLKCAEAVRRIPSLPTVDVRPTTVTVRTRTWAGGRVGVDGGYTDVDFPILPTPLVREIAQREIAGSGGRYEVGDLRVGPMTPSYPEGGFTREQLAPEATTNGVEVLYVLEGGITGEYMRVDLQTDRSLSYFLLLRRKASTP